MMSWLPRMMDRKPLIFGPRGAAPTTSLRLVRIWKLSGICMSSVACQNGS